VKKDIQFFIQRDCVMLQLLLAAHISQMNSVCSPDHNRSDIDSDVCKTVPILLFTASGTCSLTLLSALSTSVHFEEDLRA